MRMRATLNGERATLIVPLRLIGLLAIFALAAIAFAQGPSPDKNQAPKTGETVFYRAAEKEWERQTVELEKSGKNPKGRRDLGLLREFIRRWPESEFADRFFLKLMEEGTCLEWKGYPDCGIVEVRVEEEFLERYPNSPIREQVELQMARAYYQMAWLWVNGAGEHSDKWSDLFRAQSLTITLHLKKNHNPELGKAAEELEKKLTNDFPRPIAPIPSDVLSPDYL